MGAVLGACDPHGQDIFRFLMENWETLGHCVEAGTTGIALSFVLDDQPFSLAALHPGFADRKQEIILSWGGLRKKGIFSNDSIVKFQSDVGKLIELKTTANTAHIEVTENFNKQKAEALLNFMDQFTQAGILSVKKLDWIEWDSQLPNLTYDGDPIVKLNIRETLKAVDSRIQEIFVYLIQGWVDAGGSIECFQPGRIYLKFVTCEHEYGKYGVLSHRFNLVVLTSSSAQSIPSIELAWNLACGHYAYLEYASEEVDRYEESISKLPGFQREGSLTQLVLSEVFRKEHAIELLNTMLDLKSAAGN